MSKSLQPPARKSLQTSVKALRTKSEILEALDGMPFDGADLVSAAKRMLGGHLRKRRAAGRENRAGKDPAPRPL